MGQQSLQAIQEGTDDLEVVELFHKLAERPLQLIKDLMEQMVGQALRHMLVVVAEALVPRAQETVLVEV